MLEITHFHIINGTKSEPHKLDINVKDIAELEAKRKELEEKHGCFERKFGQRKRIAHIFFIYREKQLTTAV